MNCTRATRLVSESLERPLQLHERVGLRLHLMMCSGCRCFDEQAHKLSIICKAYPGEADESHAKTQDSSAPERDA
ncbi:MAG TPA: hypothetical protein ENO09_01470 [bacterium]|nr:hypothetical protein [bacterium]